LKVNYLKKEFIMSSYNLIDEPKNEIDEKHRLVTKIPIKRRKEKEFFSSNKNKKSVDYDNVWRNIVKKTQIRLEYEDAELERSNEGVSEEELEYLDLLEQASTEPLVLSQKDKWKKRDQAKQRKQRNSLKWKE